MLFNVWKITAVDITVNLNCLELNLPYGPTTGKLEGTK